MEQLNNLDVVILIIVCISALVAVVRGATKELLSIIGWVLSAVAVYYLLPIVNPIAKNYIASDLLSQLVSGAIILVLFCVFWLLTADKISSQIRASKLSSLDRIFGFVFGILRGVVIVILLQIMVATLAPEEVESGIFAESKYFQLAGESAEPIKNLIPDEWLDKVKTTTEDTDDNGAKESTDENDKDADVKTDSATEKETSAAKMEILKKSGAELFEKLVQPKTDAAYDSENQGYNDDETSDLDRLMDVLTDRVVSTNEEPSALPTVETVKEIKNIKENVSK
jgi:membrane protein required for colicin V production